jgi:7-cyano-7-deazaguanine synthase
MNVLVLASGGIDSTTCIAFYKDAGAKVSPFFVDYRQAAAKSEKSAIEAVCAYYKLPLFRIVVDSNISFGKGITLGRNALLYLLALQFGFSDNQLIASGVHAGTAYADCSPQFLQQIQQLFNLYVNGQIVAVAPFINWTKQQIWDTAKLLKVPLHLTYSCELGLEQPCSQCDSCKDLKALNALS